MLNDKRGIGLNDLTPVVITVLIIGIGLGLGLFILNQTALATSTTAYTVTNESFTVVYGDDVSTAEDCGFQTFVITSAYNESDGGNGTLIPTSEYTVSAANGQIFNTSASFGTIWNVSYTYTAAVDTSTTSSCGALDTTQTGLGGLASWITVIIVVLAAAVVLGIVVSGFGRSGAV